MLAGGSCGISLRIVALTRARSLVRSRRRPDDGRYGHDLWHRRVIENDAVNASATSRVVSGTPPQYDRFCGPFRIHV